ncbi:MAG: hypothetical protein ABR95_11985 [Sphingobacteriales bacterium BACL12 MAG-120813-bin55]|jgi:hypothetical protein|nr:MAG: hypothetical protein ABR95_11985 [Sphingobacteriales bacterium BACL12 MAG-120813-bin55]
MKGFYVIGVLLWSLLAGLGRVSAQDDSVPLLRYHLHGYLKALPSQTFDHINKDNYGLYIVHNRINQELEIGTRSSWRLEMRNRIFTGDYIQILPGYADLLELDRGLVDMTFNWLESDDIIGNTTIDRLQFNWYNGPLEITLGRQRINWGMHTVWNPNDWFNSYNFLDFDYVERPGSDAARVQYALANGSKWELAYSPGKFRNDDVGAIKYAFNTHTYDVQLLGGIYRDNVAAGLGFAGNLWQAGWKGEISWFHPYPHFSDTVARWSATTGIDYVFPNGWYTQLAWLYNEVTGAATSGAAFVYTSDARQLMPFEHSLLLQAGYPVSPLLQVNAAVIFAPENNSTIFFPTVSYSLGDNLVAAAILQVYAGSIEDNYQLQSSAVFVDLKWNFQVR